MIFPGRKVEARVIAVAPKVVRLEVFGVEISVRVRDMCHAWLVDAAERYAIGDVVQVEVKSVEGTVPESLKVTVDAKGAQEEQARAELSRCCRQGKYSGIITDVYRGTYYLRLDTGVNAIAHSATSAMVPGRGDRRYGLKWHIRYPAVCGCCIRQLCAVSEVEKGNHAGFGLLYSLGRSVPGGVPARGQRGI